MKGFIKDYRQELESDIWMMPPLYHRVWQYLKYKVNYQDNKIPLRDDGFLTIKSGQHLTSVRTIAKGVGYYEQMKWQEPNPKTISKILKWLEKQTMISIDRGEGNKQYTLITLLNWDSYQDKSDGGNTYGTPAGEGQDQPLDINKNDKECLKNDLELVVDDTHERSEESGTPETVTKEIDSYAGVIVDAYKRFNNQMVEKPADIQAAKEIAEAGIPLEDSLKYLENFIQEHEKQKKHSRDKINSLSYCVQYIFDKHYEQKEGAKDAKHPGSTQKPRASKTYRSGKGASAAELERRRTQAEQAFGYS
ncbi:hypothetical protein [Salimicrobium jeotgali]|uniref:hypothetical protein n=1 Tax=Salimicrobium jeotgali TaxID=1230341 RepID=UPI002155491A|nr:hypothetical protein [Salimicrobium jeotgali]